MEIQILCEKTNITRLKELAKNWHGILIKGSVDIEKERVAVGGDYHIESCEKLTGSGSTFNSVWGFNISFDKDNSGILEFDSLINLKPALGNRSQEIMDTEVIQKATGVIKKFIEL